RHASRPHRSGSTPFPGGYSPPGPPRHPAERGEERSPGRRPSPRALGSLHHQNPQAKGKSALHLGNLAAPTAEHAPKERTTDPARRLGSRHSKRPPPVGRGLSLPQVSGYFWLFRARR